MLLRSFSVNKALAMDTSSMEVKAEERRGDNKKNKNQESLFSVFTGFVFVVCDKKFFRQIKQKNKKGKSWLFHQMLLFYSRDDVNREAPSKMISVQTFIFLFIYFFNQKKVIVAMADEIM